MSCTFDGDYMTVNVYCIFLCDHEGQLVACHAIVKWCSVCPLTTVDFCVVGVGLAKSQSRCDMLKSPTSETAPSQIRSAEVKKSETDLHWEELLATSRRPLQLCDLDFSDLRSDDDNDVLAPTCSMNGIPPPPPPCGAPPPVPSVPKTAANKGKKTVKLFWKVKQRKF